MKDRDLLFHERWLGLAQPIEGLVFSVPVLADAQIAPEVRPELSAAFAAHVDDIGGTPKIRSLDRLFRDFLGYDKPGMLVPRSELPTELSFYAAEGGQELRPSLVLGRGPFESDDPFAAFEQKPASPATTDASKPPWTALIWDLTENGQSIDLDAPEAVTGPWRYPPTAKLERLLRHVGVPIGFLFNGCELRLVYAPTGESTAHLTFRVEHMVRPDGRPLLAALDLLLHARRAYTASPEHTLEGLLIESRRRQADVTDALAKQVFEAVEILVAGFEAAAARDMGDGDRIDWLRAALEEEGDHFYQGVLSVVLRLVFLLYSEDQSLLPVEHPTFAEHLSLFGLHARLSYDAGAHPESMHHRFGAYGQLLSLFRAVFFGVKHGSLALPPRRGRLFDPNAFPFLEGGLPGWTAAVVDPEARADARPPSVDDGTIYRVLHRLVVFEGQRLSYRALDVEQIGSVYESLMGYHVLRLTSGAVRIGKYGVWVEADAVRAMSASDRARFFKETCGLNAGPAQSLGNACDEAKDEIAVVDVLSVHAVGKKSEVLRHRAAMGRLVLQPGEERRRTASHYTPRSLTEKVVKRTLEPLLACLGRERTAEQILQLKICDPAMGSGAFLVATCRELASEIVAAWTRQGVLAKIIEEHGDAYLHARRLVAQQCLYGVDKNAAAVELAKLSLWLVTLSKSLPFTFVDHALRHGDSLVGLDFKQIEAFHWAPEKQTETCRVVLREALDQAVELRQQILALADKEDAASQSEKRRLFEFAQQAIQRVRIVADVCVGAFFSENKDAAREKQRLRRLALVEQWLAGDEDAGTQVAALAQEARHDLAPFHWWIEFPEVFVEERADPLEGGTVNAAAMMEAAVGNPPFLGGTRISQSLGDPYLHWLQSTVDGFSGKADLCVCFLRRANSLIGRHGTIGLITTATVSEGDTRVAGLAQLPGRGTKLYSAVASMPWPGTAAVIVSIVNLARGNAWEVARQRITLNEDVVTALSSRLTAEEDAPDPMLLSGNKGVCFNGVKIYGEGFVLTPEKAGSLIRENSRNKDRIWPYLGGDELNSSPTQAYERYVINFEDMSLEECRRWPDLLTIVDKEVRPYRLTVNRAFHKENWWKYGDRRPGLYRALAPLERCLVSAQITKHLCFSFHPTRRVFSQKAIVFALWQYSHFAILQSRLHTLWAERLSSSLGETMTYTGSRVFETFPFPTRDPLAGFSELEDLGKRLYDARSEYMATVGHGFTKTYNSLKDPACTAPEILELRRLHEALDRAVLNVYGWNDVVVPRYCPESETDKQGIQTFGDNVLDRLNKLNAQRAREEQQLGLAVRSVRTTGDDDNFDSPEEGSEQPAKPARGKKGKSAKATKGQGKLFE